MAIIKIYGKLQNATESGKIADYNQIDGAPELVQATGQNSDKVMSQKAVSDAINTALGLPIAVSTAAEMNAVLTAANVGKAYKYTGTTDSKYTNGDIYIVESGE